MDFWRELLDLSACGLVCCCMIVELIAFDWLRAKWRVR
jgi:hypothetical protein